MSEIDSLEIVIEAEASKASRALRSLEKRLDDISKSLLKMQGLVKGGFKFDDSFAKSLVGDKSLKSVEKLGKKMADNLISGFNLNGAGKEVIKQAQKLSKDIANGMLKDGLSDSVMRDIDALGELVAKNGSVAQDVQDDYRELYETIKAIGKIKVNPSMLKEDMFKERNGLLRQKMSSQSGVPLDSIYQELSGKFKGLLPDETEVANAEDQFVELDNAIKKYFELSQNSVKPAWLETSAWSEVLSEAGELNRKVKEINKETAELGSGEAKPFSEMFDVDTSGIESTKREIDSIFEASKRMKSSTSSVEKFPKISSDSLKEKFANSKFSSDLGGNSVTQLKTHLASMERGYARVKESIKDMVELEGSDSLSGKNWYRNHMELMKYKNEIIKTTEMLRQLNSVKSEPTIEDHMSDSLRAKPVESSGSKRINTKENYNPDAMKAVFGKEARKLKDFNDVVNKFGGSAGNAARKLNELGNSSGVKKLYDYESVIKRLKSELKELAKTGLMEGDSEYDKKAKEIARATAELKRYNRAMKESALSEIKNDFGLGVKGNMSKTFNNAIKSSKKFFSSLSKGTKSAISGFAKLGRMISGLKEKQKKGISLGRMLGSSVLFSTVFQVLGTIQRAIVEGSNNLVQYSKSYNSSISSIMTSLSYLKNSWAAAFAPIVNVVAPYLQAFINMIASALNAVGRFFAALTGKGFAVQAKSVWQDYGTGISGAGRSADDANKAMKELKKTVLGFDELNIMNDNSDKGSGGSSGGGGGGAGGISPGEMFETVEVDGPLADFAKQLREAFLKEDWEGLGQILADGVNNGLQKLYDAISWKNVGPRITEFADAFTRTFNSLVDGVDWELLGRTVGTGLNTIANTLDLFITKIDWKNLGKKFSDGLNGFVYEVNWEKLGSTIANKAMIIVDVLSNMFAGIDWKEIGLSLSEGISGLLNNIDFGTISETIVSFVNGISTALLEFVTNLDVADATKELAQGIVDTITGIDWLTLFAAVGGALGTGIGVVLGSLLEAVNKSAQKIHTAFIKPVTDKLEKFGKDAGRMLKESWESVKKTFSNVPDYFKEKFDKAKSNITSAFSTIGSWFGEKASTIKKAFSDAPSYFKEKFNSAKSSVTSAFSNIGSWFSARYSDIKSAMKNVNTFFSDKFKQAYKGMTSAFDDLPSFFKSIPGKIKKSLGNLYSIGKSLMKDFAAGFRSINIKTPHFKVDGGKFPFGFGGEGRFPSVKIQWYAKGGFPAPGELFVANESGPEMIGKMGNRNVVANNNQIANGIKQAVVEGMMQVYMATRDNSNGVPYILNATLKTEDNEVLARAVEKGRISMDSRQWPSPAY